MCLKCAQRYWADGSVYAPLEDILHGLPEALTYLSAMRVFCLSVPLALALTVGAQVLPEGGAHPLVITDAAALPSSSAQIFHNAVKEWTYSFGQEPGARLVQIDTAGGTLMGTARYNFRSTAVGSREESMGVITYEVAIQSQNGQCRVRIGHFVHTGNRNAPGGGVDLGTIYAGDRPPGKVAGVSAGTASRLQTDMRTQLQVHLELVLKNFLAAMRRNSEQMK